MTYQDIFTSTNRNTALIVFLVLLCIATLAQFTGSEIQTDFGSVHVENTRLHNESGLAVRGKLFRPVEASKNYPLPGVVFVHGYQSTRETGDAIAIELSRRGVVVLSIDTLGRGNSGNPSRDRNAPDFDETFGARAAFNHLKSLEFVSSDRVGLVGHSLGAEMAFKVALQDSTVKALVLMGYAYTKESTFNNPKNMLMIIGQYDEFRNRMTDVGNIERDWMSSPQTASAIDVPNPKLETTYGSFDDGNARRVVVPKVIHIYETHSKKAIAEVLDWIRQGLSPPDRLWKESHNQIGILKEWSTLIAMLSSFAAILPLGFLLLGLGAFAQLQSKGEKKVICTRRDYWTSAIINGILMWLYPIFIVTIFAVHKYIAPIDGVFPMMVVNATVWWFMWINIIGFLLLRRWQRKQQGAGVTWGRLSIGYGDGALKIDWISMGKTALLAFFLFLFIYGFEVALEHIFITDFRFIFSFASDLTAYRFLMFLLYMPFLLIGFLQLTFFLHGQIRMPSKSTLLSTFFSWSTRNLLTLIVPLILLMGVQYIPLLTTGAIPLVGPGGLFVLFMMNLFHIVGVLMLIVPISTWLFLLTDRPYLSAILNAAIVSWMFTSSQVIAPVPV